MAITLVKAGQNPLFRVISTDYDKILSIDKNMSEYVDERPY